MRLVKELNCGQISCIQISWAAPVTQAADLDFSPLLHNSCPLPSNSILHLPASWLKQSNQISIYIIFLSQITNITTPPPLLIHLAAPAECSFQHLMLMPASDHRLLHHHRRCGSTQSRNDDCRLRVCRLFISEFISVHRDSSAMLQQVFHRSRVWDGGYLEAFELFRQSSRNVSVAWCEEDLEACSYHYVLMNGLFSSGF